MWDHLLVTGRRRHRPRLRGVGGLEYRAFVDNNRLPIQQTTSLKTLNLTGGIRFALAPRGREISRLAWVPSTVVPYVGAGGGMLWYQFRQAGDFIDALDPRLAVFSDTFTADGWTPSAHVLGGVDVKVYRRLYLTLDGRYIWAAGDWAPISRTSTRSISRASGSGRINVVF